MKHFARYYVLLPVSHLCFVVALECFVLNTTLQVCLTHKVHLLCHSFVIFSSHHFAPCQMYVHVDMDVDVAHTLALCPAYPRA